MAFVRQCGDAICEGLFRGCRKFVILKGLFSEESYQSSGKRRINCHDFGCFTSLFVGFLLK